MNATEVNALSAGLYKLICTNGTEVLAAVGNMSDVYRNKTNHPLKWFTTPYGTAMTASYGEAWNSIKEAVLLFANEDIEMAGKPRVAEPVSQDDIRQNLVDHSKRLMESHQELMGVYKQYIEEGRREKEVSSQSDYEILQFRMQFLLHALNCIDERRGSNTTFMYAFKKIEFGYTFSSSGKIEKHCILPLKVTSHIQNKGIIHCVEGYCPSSNQYICCYLDQVYPLSYVNDDKAKNA